MSECSSGKCAHPDYETAQRVLKESVRRKRKGRKVVRVYRCDECKLWHLTGHRDNKKRRAA